MAKDIIKIGLNEVSLTQNLLNAEFGEEVRFEGVVGVGLLGRLASLGLLPGIPLKR